MQLRTFYGEIAGNGTLQQGVYLSGMETRYLKTGKAVRACLADQKDLADASRKSICLPTPHCA